MKDEMVLKKRQENMREDRKRLGRFVLWVCIGGICGFGLGFLGVGVVDYMESEHLDFLSFGSMMTEFWGLAGRYLLILVNCIALPIMWVLFFNHKKEVAGWNGEDEEYIEKVDRKLGIDMAFSAALMIFEMFAYGVGLYGMTSMPDQVTGLVVMDLLFFVGSLFCIIFYQKCIVNLLKELNPEKQGSVFDRKFSKVWFASCDEAEKQKIGEASYKTYLVMTMIYQVLCMILMVAGFFFPIGMLPFIIVCLLWMVQTVLYSVYCR